jgi:cytochrome oxidase Cu insertion factor (SCO1/SenC/PrrC family)
MTAAAATPTQNRRIMLVMLVITLAPVIVSSLLYFFGKPQGGHSYGKLLETKPVPTFAMTTVDGKPAAMDDFKGKWLLVTVDAGGCAQACLDTLHALRQIRMAQGAEMERVRRLWLVNDGMMPAAAATSAADGADIRLVHGSIPLPEDLTTSIYLIDPLGNQVMRYGRDQDHGKVIKEINRLLKNNEALG